MIKRISWELRIDDGEPVRGGAPFEGDPATFEEGAPVIARLVAQQFYATLCRDLFTRPITITDKDIMSCLGLDLDGNPLEAFDWRE